MAQRLDEAAVAREQRGLVPPTPRRTAAQSSTGGREEERRPVLDVDDPAERQKVSAKQRRDQRQLEVARGAFGRPVSPPFAARTISGGW